MSHRGHVELTDLGHRLADEHTRPAALVEAFLKVPLYRAIYDDYQGKSLPGDAGLENDIRSKGVVANQTDRARQALQRSAEKAGLFWSGRTRLVMPPTSTLGEPAKPPSDQPPPPPKGGDEKGDVLSNALLVALFKKMLPEEDKEFSAKDRRRFFRALAVNLDVIYGEPSDGSLNAEALADLFKEDPPVAGAPSVQQTGSPSVQPVVGGQCLTRPATRRLRNAT